eukprot:194582_1
MSKMRVMYIHAGKRIDKDLKSDEYHVKLFEEKLRLRFENNVETFSRSSLDIIEDLPRGAILGVAIFNDTYWFHPQLHQFDPWNLGPFCYGILDVFRFQYGVKACGQLGIWIPKQDAQNRIVQQKSIANKINEWKQTYGDQLYFGKNGVVSAVTILQPFVEGILRGVKRTENRKRPIFRIHDNKKLYKHPTKPTQTRCRFCPDDGTDCVYWAHVNTDNIQKRNICANPYIKKYWTKEYNFENELQGYKQLGISSNTYRYLITCGKYSFDQMLQVLHTKTFSKKRMLKLDCSQQPQYFVECLQKLQQKQ